MTKKNRKVKKTGPKTTKFQVLICSVRSFENDWRAWSLWQSVWAWLSASKRNIQNAEVRCSKSVLLDVNFHFCKISNYESCSTRSTEFPDASHHGGPFFRFLTDFHLAEAKKGKKGAPTYLLSTLEDWLHRSFLWVDGKGASNCNAFKPQLQLQGAAARKWSTNSSVWAHSGPYYPSCNTEFWLVAPLLMIPCKYPETNNSRYQKKKKKTVLKSYCFRQVDVFLEAPFFFGWFIRRIDRLQQAFQLLWLGKKKPKTKTNKPFWEWQSHCKSIRKNCVRDSSDRRSITRGTPEATSSLKSCGENVGVKPAPGQLTRTIHRRTQTNLFQTGSVSNLHPTKISSKKKKKKKKKKTTQGKNQGMQNFRTGTLLSVSNIRVPGKTVSNCSGKYLQ